MTHAYCNGQGVRRDGALRHLMSLLFLYTDTTLVRRREEFRPWHTDKGRPHSAFPRQGELARLLLWFFSPPFLSFLMMFNWKIITKHSTVSPVLSDFGQAPVNQPWLLLEQQQSYVTLAVCQESMLTYSFVQAIEWVFLSLSFLFVSLRIKAVLRRGTSTWIPEVILFFGLIVETGGIICDTLTNHLGRMTGGYLSVPVTLPLNKVYTLLLLPQLEVPC